MARSREEADPTAAFRCVECGAEFTALYERSSCMYCDGTVQRLSDGSVVVAGDAGLGAVEESDEEDEVVLGRFPTENPWLLRVFEHPDFGLIPALAERVFRAAVPDPDERILVALHTRHGAGQRGYFVLTTEYPRWFQTFPTTRNTMFWPYDYPLEVVRNGLGGVIRTVSGDQFQVLWTKARRFGELHKLVQQAMSWEASRSPSEIVEPNGPRPDSGLRLAEELERVAALHERGLLTADEFVIAKRRLLGGS